MNSQNAITAAALVVAFLIFITVRGELPAYFGVLGLGSKAVSAKAGQTGFGFTGGGGSVTIGGSLGGVTIGTP